MMRISGRLTRQRTRLTLARSCGDSSLPPCRPHDRGRCAPCPPDRARGRPPRPLPQPGACIGDLIADAAEEEIVPQRRRREEPLGIIELDPFGGCFRGSPERGPSLPRSGPHSLVEQAEAVPGLDIGEGQRQKTRPVLPLQIALPSAGRRRMASNSCSSSAPMKENCANREWPGGVPGRSPSWSRRSAGPCDEIVGQLRPSMALRNRLFSARFRPHELGEIGTPNNRFSATVPCLL